VPILAKHDVRLGTSNSILSSWQAPHLDSEGIKVVELSIQQ